MGRQSPVAPRTAATGSIRPVVSPAGLSMDTFIRRMDVQTQSLLPHRADHAMIWMNPLSTGPRIARLQRHVTEPPHEFTHVLRPEVGVRHGEMAR